MTDTAEQRRPLALAIFLVVGGVIGFIAAFALTLDKFQTLENPSASLGCDFSLLVQCGKNLESAQGAAFGFPNPVIGLAGFFTVLVVGMSILAGARFARWYWIVFNLGLTFAICFVAWLIGQSIFVLGTLCPWCMVVWSVTIPLFVSVTLYNLSTGNIPNGERSRGLFTTARSWTPLITLVCYVIVAALAQLQLNVLAYI
ncbi:MAG TPA: vitamin K epoxide reductase family protein [Galbitalea sp.]